MPEPPPPDDGVDKGENESPVGVYRIVLDGEWLFDELSVLPNLYVQVYGFFAALQNIVKLQEVELSPLGTGFDEDSGTYFHTFNYPWAGGWSSANFYRTLMRTIPPEAYPRVIRIHFASPGFIDLALWSTVAAAARRCINESAKTVGIVHKTYDDIYRAMQERKLLAFDVRKKQLELSKLEIEFIVESRQRLGVVIGLSEAEQRAVARLSPGTIGAASAENELGIVKVLLSLVRRLVGLAKFEIDGKAKF